jgi:hypothetical protein
MNPAGGTPVGSAPKTNFIAGPLYVTRGTRVNRQRLKNLPMKINFACTNCLEIFDVDMITIEFDKTRELVFNPIPECTYCGATEEVVLSNFGLQQIDLMILHNKIPTIKSK